MQIKTVTITGADEEVAVADLIEMGQKYPFVEWGILYSLLKRGPTAPRYPTLKWIDRLCAAGATNLSAHFCGWHAREVLENQRWDLIEDLPPAFKRVQLNYNFTITSKWSLTHLDYWCKENPGISIILQYNKSNATVLNSYMKIGLVPNIHILHDASGGRGTEIKNIPPPFKNYTGYAGGISEINVGTVCSTLFALPGGATWLDLETGARTDNKFDLGKVAYILKVAENYISHD